MVRGTLFSLMITLGLPMFFLITEKSNTLDSFKIYKVEVEHQLEKTVNIVRSDRLVNIKEDRAVHYSRYSKTERRN